VAGVYDISADQGATWSEVWTWLDADGVPVDLTGYAAKLDWVAHDGTVLLSLTDRDGIALGGPSGTVTPTASAAQTGAVPAKLGVRYDLFLTSPGGVVTRLLAGAVNVTPRVTQ
jgi:hypothetical protein